LILNKGGIRLCRRPKSLRIELPFRIYDVDSKEAREELVLFLLKFKSNRKVDGISGLFKGKFLLSSKLFLLILQEDLQRNVYFSFALPKKIKESVENEIMKISWQRPIYFENRLILAHFSSISTRFFSNEGKSVGNLKFPPNVQNIILIGNDIYDFVQESSNHKINQ